MRLHQTMWSHYFFSDKPFFAFGSRPLVRHWSYDFLFCTNLIGKVNDFVLDMQEICKKRDANVVFCISFCSFCKRSSLSLE